MFLPMFLSMILERIEILCGIILQRELVCAIIGLCKATHKPFSRAQEARRQQFGKCNNDGATDYREN